MTATLLSMAAAAAVLVGGLLMLARLVHDPGRGIHLLLVSALLLPVEFMLGATALSLCFLYTAFLLATWILRLVLIERTIVLYASRIVIATLLFMAAALLSFLVGQYPWFPIEGAPLRAQLGGLSLYILSGGVLLLVAHEVKTLPRLKRLTWVFVGVGGLTLLTMFVPATDIVVGPMLMVDHGSIGSLFFTWLVAMSVSQALWNDALGRTTRAALLAVAALTLGRGLFVTFDWASGWLPPIIALGALMLFRFPRLTVSAGLLMLVPIAVVSGMAWESLMEGESWSWMTRLEAQRVLQQVIAREPFLGLGPANYHFYTYLFPILGYRIRFNSHNNYTDLLAQGGIVGLVLFFWVALGALRLAYALYRRVPDGFSRAYALGTFSGVLASLAAAMLADWIVPFVYNIGIVGFRSSVLFWIFIGGLVALKRLHPASASVGRDQLVAIINALNQHAARPGAAPAPVMRWRPRHALAAHQGLGPIGTTGDAS